MEVGIDRLTTIGGGSREELAAVLTAFERATDMQICIKTLSGRWGPDGGLALIGPYLEHRSPFCSNVKHSRLAKCIKNENTDLAGACATPDGPSERPMVRTCHAGADEVLLPLWSDGALVGMLCAGQFVNGRRSSGRRSVALPELDATQIEHIASLLTPVRSYLLDLFTSEERRLRSSHGHTRANEIEAYIRESLSAGPELAVLARRMLLSPSRARHVVSETTGHSFQQLVKAQRLLRAKDLLINSDARISWIAGQVGLRDTAYFCRFFKTNAGVTPSTFRTTHRRALSA